MPCQIRNKRDIGIMMLNAPREDPDKTVDFRNDMHNGDDSLGFGPNLFSLDVGAVDEQYLL